MGEDELSDLGVESVSVDALAGGQDQGGAGAVSAVSSSNHLGAGAENVGKLSVRALLLLTSIKNTMGSSGLVKAIKRYVGSFLFFSDESVTAVQREAKGEMRGKP